MSVLILSLFNGILLFRQRTEQSVLYHVCPDAEGLGGTLTSACAISEVDGCRHLREIRFFVTKPFYKAVQGKCGLYP